jgi:hypothetical protein
LDISSLLPKAAICGYNDFLGRDEEKQNVVPHSNELLAASRFHHCLEMTHSDQCIGYVLKGCYKNSDDGWMFLEHVRYEDRPVRRSERPKDFVETRISSGRGRFTRICGSWRHHRKPTMNILNIHLEGEKIIMAFDAHENMRRMIFPTDLRDILAALPVRDTAI